MNEPRYNDEGVRIDGYLGDAPRPVAKRPIRVLRLMEYVYPDVESMEADMGRWAIPANGKRSLGIGRGKSISSTVLPLTVLDNLPEVPLPDEDML